MMRRRTLTAGATVLLVASLLLSHTGPAAAGTDTPKKLQRSEAARRAAEEERRAAEEASEARTPYQHVVAIQRAAGACDTEALLALVPVKSPESRYKRLWRELIVSTLKNLAEERANYNESRCGEDALARWRRCWATITVGLVKNEDAAMLVRMVYGDNIEKERASLETARRECNDFGEVGDAAKFRGMDRVTRARQLIAVARMPPGHDGVETMREYIDAGANLSAKDPEGGATALHRTVDPAMAELLMAKKADPTVLDSAGLSPLGRAFQRCGTNPSESDLQVVDALLSTKIGRSMLNTGDMTTPFEDAVRGCWARLTEHVANLIQQAKAAGGGFASNFEPNSSKYDDQWGRLWTLWRNSAQDRVSTLSSAVSGGDFSQAAKLVAKARQCLETGVALGSINRISYADRQYRLSPLEFVQPKTDLERLEATYRHLVERVKAAGALHASTGPQIETDQDVIVRTAKVASAEAEMDHEGAWREFDRLTQTPEGQRAIYARGSAVYSPFIQALMSCQLGSSVALVRHLADRVKDGSLMEPYGDEIIPALAQTWVEYATSEMRGYKVTLEARTTRREQASKAAIDAKRCIEVGRALIGIGAMGRAAVPLPVSRQNYNVTQKNLTEPLEAIWRRLMAALDKMTASATVTFGKLDG